MPKKPKRLRGHDLALHLDRASHYQGVVKARTKQQYLSADYKLSHGISLNIYDAARSYQAKEGKGRGLREILKDDTFRNAWGTFKGGHRWEYSQAKGEWVKKYRKKGGITSTTEEKLKAAKVLGWYGDDIDEPIGKLRNISP